MNDNPKIMVFQLKELIYTVIFVILGILLIFLLLYMFLRNDDDASDATYVPGTYTSSLTIGSIPMEVSVKVDTDRILDISLSPVGDSVETMFPLLNSSLDNIKDQIISSQSLENIYLTSDSTYTYEILMNNISAALKKAAVKSD